MAFRFTVLIFVLGFTSLPLNAKSLHDNGFNLGYPHVRNQLIVKFADKIRPEELPELIGDIGATQVDKFSFSGATLLEFVTQNDEQVDLLEKAKMLAALPTVEYVEANIIRRLLVKIPNDPRFKEQYALDNQGGPFQTKGCDIDAVEAWDFTTGSAKVIVAVNDSGIDYKHPDLGPNLWKNPGEMGLDANGRDKSTNGVDDDGNGYIDDWRGWDFLNGDNDPMDDRGHGSHCSGIIGAKGNDGVGITGVNWNVSLMATKTFNSNGEGPLSAIIKAVEYATIMGAVVVNESFGSDGSSRAERDTIDKAGKKGVLFTIAAGNSTSDNDQNPIYPASYPLENIIAVAATDAHDKLEDFSNFGVSSVHLAAPGGGILSTVLNGQYEMWGGTSMAAPHVAGSAALVKSVAPAMLPRDIKMLFLKTVDKKPSLDGKVQSGGRLNIFKALSALNN